MTTYSQYDESSGFTSQEIGTTYTRTWTCNGLSSNAIRYYGGAAGWAIAFNTDTASTGVHTWRDDGNSFPYEFSNDQVNWFSGSSVGCPDAATIYIRNQGGGTHSFPSPQWQYSSANPANSGGGPDPLSDDDGEETGTKPKIFRNFW